MKKKLYRNTKEEMFGGVCSGLSNYLNIDVSFIRIAFVLSTLVFGFGVFLYLIMVFIVPEK